MSLYDDASLIMYPSGYKEDKIYSLKPTDGSGDLTFTRASTATRVNAEGLIETSPVNLAAQSETFDNASWAKFAVGTGVAPAVTADTTIAPNGTTTADTVIFDAGAGTTASDMSLLRQNISGTGSTPYTFSIYAKVASGTAKIIARHAGGGGFTTLNLTTDWQRFVIIETLVTTGTFTIEFGIRRGLSNEPLTTPVTCQIWGAQLNIGATAKPYFPTTDRLNVPRIDYTGGGCGSLLLEKQSTNEVQYSQELNNAYWLKYQSSITANQGISPDGTQNADLMTSSGADSVLYRVLASCRVLSYFAKAVNLSSTSKFYI